MITLAENTESAIEAEKGIEIEPANVLETMIWEERRRRGRPTTFTWAKGAEIIRRIIAGETLYRICQDESMPERGTVLDWAERIPDFGHSFQHARGKTAGHWAEKAMDDVQTCYDRDTAAAAKVKLDAAKWYAGILNPKEYGQSTGGDGSPRFIFNVASLGAIGIQAAPAPDAALPMIDAAPALPASDR
jgi:hypothetical protein